jgi:ankyrin repeat protein
LSVSDINLSDEDGNTALHLAVTSGEKESVETLLQHGASADIYNQKKFAPIHVAVDLRPDMIDVSHKTN